MRRVIRDYSRKPAILKQPGTIALWDSIATSGNIGLLQERLYKDPHPSPTGVIFKVLQKLELWYFKKCAYCERIYKLDVEHFRPKGRIKDENGGVISATGYYWLCYEWSNLLPSCISCNREGGKLDKFPFLPASVRVTNPTLRSGRLNKASCLVSKPHYIAERPYLVNPEIDDPENFFAFRLSDNGTGIEIYGFDADNRGDITQRICMLNRPELRIVRAQVIAPFIQAIHSLFNLYRLGHRTGAQLAQEVDTNIQILHDQSHNIELDHTLLRRYIIRNIANFRAIVSPFLTAGVRPIVEQAFSNYIPI